MANSKRKYCEENDEFTNILNACRNSDINSLRNILPSSFVNNRNENGNTPLFLALLFERNKSFECFKLLLEQDNIDLYAKVYSVTILHELMGCSSETLILEVIPIILKRAPLLIDCVNKYNQCALNMAVASKKLNVVKLLIENGANIHLANINNQNAIHLSISFPSFDIFEYLLYWTNIYVRYDNVR